MADKLSNYIPISRKLFEHPFFHEPRTFSKFEAWVDLLQEARYDNKEGSRIIGNKVVTFSRGEIPASLRFLAERWNWSKNKVDSFIELLVNEGMITKRTAKGTSQTIITICKYDEYNAIQKESGQEKGQHRDSIGTASGQNSNIVNKENNVIGEVKKFLSKSIDDCLQEYFTSPTFTRSKELLCIHEHLRSENDLRALAIEFNDQQAIKGELMCTQQEWAKHFGFWVKDPKRKAAKHEKSAIEQQTPSETATQRRERLLKEQQQLINSSRR